MFELLNRIDTQLFLFLNGLNNGFWDIIMWNISKTGIWLPLYATILFFIFRKLKWQGFITLAALILMILLADQGSVQLFKNTFERLRPCHEPDLTGLVHIVNGKCGGKFGFVSSHASNTFAFAMFVALFFKNRKITAGLFIWATIVSYSRIYLGVHYPFDVLGGALWGMICGYFIFYIHQKVLGIIRNKKSPEKGLI